MSQKTEVKGKNIDGDEVVVYIQTPNSKDNRDAQKYASKIFQEALKEGSILKDKLEEVLREQGLWDDEKQTELEALDKRIDDGVLKIRKGGCKLSEAREVAIDIQKARMERTLLRSNQIKFDSYTVEGQADDAKFDFLVSRCVKDEEGHCIFEDIEDYKRQSSQPYVVEAASTFANLFYGMDPDWEKKLPENEFLIKYKFVDEDMNYIDKEGRRISSDGKLIDDDGFYINEAGDRVDSEGNLVDKDGLPIVESSPFLDDDGNPV